MMPRLLRPALLSLLLLFAGCGDDDVPPCDPGSFDCLTFEDPRDVIAGLVIAYESRNCADYARLLAIDFQFHFDTELLPPGGPATWSRLDDSTGTCALFQAPEVTGIELRLTPGDDEPVTTPDRESWRLIRVSDTLLRVGLDWGGGGEDLIYEVDGDDQEFYLRQGRSPADTLASSPTAKRWYLVEWRDLGRDFQSPGRAPLGSASIASWSHLKGMFR